MNSIFDNYSFSVPLDQDIVHQNIRVIIDHHVHAQEIDVVTNVHDHGKFLTRYPIQIYCRSIMRIFVTQKFL